MNIASTSEALDWLRRCILVRRNLRDAMEATLYFVIAGAVGN